jgi:hypothetical protein
VAGLLFKASALPEMESGGQAAADDGMVGSPAEPNRAGLADPITVSALTLTDRSATVLSPPSRPDHRHECCLFHRIRCGTGFADCLVKKKNTLLSDGQKRV